MAFISVTGEPAARHEELARSVAQRLRFELVTKSRLAHLLVEEFGAETPVPDRAYRHAVSSILARLATAHPLVISVPGAELLFPKFPGVLRVRVTTPESRRVGNLMLDCRLERRAARDLLRQLERDAKEDRKKKFGRATLSAAHFDLILSAEAFGDGAAVAIVETAARACGLLLDDNLLSAAAEAQLQFQLRLELARHGIVPAGKASLSRKPFGHPSEEMFANLWDFYRIVWEYEPRSFPLQWDKDGNVTEAFTPDFYLPEADLYIELTTMKQALVTKKNRKVRLLREIYPHINIQVFYQKDFQDLVFKHGLPRHASTV
jgi:hypothetical protein